MDPLSIAFCGSLQLLLTSHSPRQPFPRSVPWKTQFDRSEGAQDRAYLNSTKVPRLTGHSISLIYLKQKLTSFLYFSSPSHPMNVVLANLSPNRYAVSPFSEKQKSKRVVTGREGVPSCSCCLMRSEPPTKPMAHLCRRAERSCSISGEAC